MIILSTLSLYSNNDEHRDQISSMSREMAQRLGGCLDDTYIHATTRLLAIQLMGQGWDLWQKFVNPFSVLQSLIDLLYKNGFVAAEGTGQQLQTSMGIEQLTPEARRIRKEFIKKCRQSIRGIALQNSTLLVSVLSIYIRSPDHLIDARIAALRLLTSFITPVQISDDDGEDGDNGDNGALLNDVHLPTIISNVVHLLEPANTTAREVSATGGVSLLNEITQFLTTALQQYPSTLAFHKGQQRLAVALIGTHGNSAAAGSAPLAEPNLILGFVYDLRSGTAMAMLSARATSLAMPPPLPSEPKGSAPAEDIYIGAGITQLSHIVFSPDGKHLAGLLTVPTAGSARGVAIVVVWKIGFGFMSLLHNISLSLPSPATAMGASAAPSPAALTPKTGGTPARSTSPTRGVPGHQHSHSLPYNSLGTGTVPVPELVVNSGAGAGGGSSSSGHSSPSVPSTPAAVLEDQTNANKLTVYPKLLKAVRVPWSASTGGASDKGATSATSGTSGTECTVSWRSDKVLVLKAGSFFVQDIKISI